MSGGENEPEWWAKSARESRSRPLAALAVMFLAMAGVGGYFMFGRNAPVALATSPDAGGLSAVEDPASLLPIAMRRPTPQTDEIFTSKILRFTIALDEAAKRGAADGDGGAASTELAAAEEALRGAEVHGALGPRASSALEELMTTAKAAARAAPADEASVTAFETATARLDNALVVGGFPYFVDASVIVDEEQGKRLLLLYEFSILSTSLHASGEARVRSVRLRRLDRLNWSHTLLGFVNPHRSYAVVLLDQIDEQLVTNVVPALAPEAAMPLLANEAQREGGPGPTGPEAIAISLRAGKNVRVEVDELLGTDVAAGRELGEAVRARRTLFEKWNERLRARGTLKSPARLELDVDALEKEVAGAIPKTDLDELRRLQKRLDGPDVRKAYATLRDVFIASVERHEVQHRLDHMRAIPTPKPIDALVPPGQGSGADNVRDHVKSELSAYLAQIAREEPLTKTTFTMLLRFLADPRVRGGVESYAALIATEELAAELDIKGVAPLLRDRKLDDARIEIAHRELTSVPAPALREAARKVWGRLFAGDLAPLTKLP